MKTDLNSDDLDDLLRILRSNEAWFDSSHAWLAPVSASPLPHVSSSPRPLSLASLDALKLMGLDFAEGTFDTREIALYRWLHIAPLHEVKAAIWTGSWRTLFAEPPQLADEVIAAFRDERTRLSAILSAVTVSVRAKPKKENARNETPSDVIAPTLATFRAVTIASALNADLEHVRWHLPIVQALQVYHFALWENGNWTVMPGREAKAEDLEDLTPDALRED